MRLEALHIELLHDCPCACLACDHRLAGKARLQPAALRGLFRRPELKSLRLVSFSGGEPLLYPGLDRELRAAASAFPSAALILLTSFHPPGKALALLRRLPEKVRRRLHIGSSLDGPEKVHDMMRGTPGAFSALKNSVKAISKEFPGLSAGLTFTATRLNAPFFREAWEEARGMGLPLAPQFLVPNANTAGLGLDRPSKKAFSAALRKAVGACASDADAAPLRQALDFLGGGPAGTCGAGSTFLMLAPEGHFYLCPFHKDLTAEIAHPEKLCPPAGGPRTRHCAQCFLRCAR